MEGDTTANSAITPAPHGTSQYVQHSITTHLTHGITGIHPFRITHTFDMFRYRKYFPSNIDFASTMH